MNWSVQGMIKTLRGKFLDLLIPLLLCQALPPLCPVSTHPFCLVSTRLSFVKGFSILC